MCIIIDVNVAAFVLGESKDSTYEPVIDWLFGDASVGVVVYGGKVWEELKQNHSVASSLVQLKRAGRAIPIVDTVVNAETDAVRNLEILSDDPHVLALARVSGCRILCTDDLELMKDFKCKSILDKPRGRVYTKHTQKHLLCHNSICRRPTARR